MRVALLSPLFESVPPRLYGGTERVIYNLCRGLNDANVEVTLFASGDSSVDSRIIPIIDQATRLRKTPLTEPNVYNFRMLSKVAEMSWEFDIIHNHHDYWMLPLTQMSNTPLLTTLHGRLDIPEVPSVHHAYPSGHYVSISESQRKAIPELRWASTVYHGIDTELYEFREKPGKYLAFLGRISRDKRPEWAIEMAKKSGVPLKIAAKIEGEADTAFYETYVKPHVDGKFIEYIGEISESEKSDFLGNALALAFPIDWPEPFGLVMIEALACGTPVLARPCGSVPEILKNGVTGFIDPSIACLSAQVANLHKIDRAKCRQWVEDRFSLRRMTEDYLNVYRQLIEFNSNRSRFGRAGGIAHDRRYFLHSVQCTTDGNT